MNQEQKFNKVKRKADLLPDGGQRLLLHSCCVVCTGEPLEQLLCGEFEFAVFFYNPNIFPENEYILRRDEALAHCERLGIPFIEGPYNPESWEKSAGVHGPGREGGERCAACFEERLRMTADVALAEGYDTFATTLGISRWKNLKLIDQIGDRVGKQTEAINYWPKNWRKKGGSQRMYEIAKYYDFYMQDYCGCRFSIQHKKEN